MMSELKTAIQSIRARRIAGLRGYLRRPVQTQVRRNVKVEQLGIHIRIDNTDRIYPDRNVEEIVRGGVDAAALEQARKEKPAQRKPKLPEEFNLLKDHLSSFFNTKVQLVCNEKGKGKITIPFASEDELEKLIGLLDKLK